jgi:hypothetical protein
MSQRSRMSQQELARKIVHLHDVLGMGFRRVAKELTTQGCTVNKDSANRLYNEYKTGTSVEVMDNKDLRHLKLAEARQRQRFEVQKEIEVIRHELTVLFVENNTLTFEQRKNLFTDENKLFRFTRKVLCVLDPMLWEEFTGFCVERGYDTANAVAIALGNQKDYETQLNYSDARQRFDLYLQEAIRTCLANWKKEEEEGYDNSQDAEPEPLTIGEGTETVTIDLPDGMLY